MTKSGNSLDEVVGRAQAALEAGDLAGAHKLLDGVPATSRDVRLTRALVLATEERGEEALETIDAALAEFPDDLALLNTRASILMDTLDDPFEALPLYEELALTLTEERADRLDEPEAARELGSLLQDVLLQLSECRGRLGDTAGALEAARAAVRLDERNAGALVSLAQAHFDVVQIEDAQRVAEQALAAEPGNADAHWLLGRIATLQGQPADAEREFAAAVASGADRYGPPTRVETEALQRLLMAGTAELPKQLRDYVRRLPVQIQDVPSLAQLASMDPPLSPGVLALIEGEAPDPTTVEDLWKHAPRAVHLFRRNLEIAARSTDELRELAMAALLGEVGRYLGLDAEEPAS